MTNIHHLNCGWLHAPPSPRACCHCLLLEDPSGLALIDTGIGLQDVLHPADRLGQELIDLAGFQLNEADTALRQIERRGLRSKDVRHIVLTHADPDHTGGLADLPEATVHIAAEELDSLNNGSWRYVASHFAHGPTWQPHSSADQTWFGLAARPLPLGFDAEILMIPLFGHTLGHCGVAVQQPGGWLLHVGDAYYLRAELDTDDHSVSQLAEARADDNQQRLASLKHLRRLARDHAGEITLCGYHDTSELRVMDGSRSVPD